jgi:hypothetical protein
MDVPLWVRFTATERRERGAAHRVLIEPSLDDACTAVTVGNPIRLASEVELGDALR